MELTTENAEDIMPRHYFDKMCCFFMWVSDNKELWGGGIRPI